MCLNKTISDISEVIWLVTIFCHSSISRANYKQISQLGNFLVTNCNSNIQTYTPAGVTHTHTHTFLPSDDNIKCGGFRGPHAAPHGWPLHDAEVLMRRRAGNVDLVEGFIKLLGAVLIKFNTRHRGGMQTEEVGLVNLGTPEKSWEGRGGEGREGEGRGGEEGGEGRGGEGRGDGRGGEGRGGEGRGGEGRGGEGRGGEGEGRGGERGGEGREGERGGRGEGGERGEGRGGEGRGGKGRGGERGGEGRGEERSKGETSRLSFM